MDKKFKIKKSFNIKQLCGTKRCSLDPENNNCTFNGSGDNK
jgi:hypothetical protein